MLRTKESTYNSHPIITTKTSTTVTISASGGYGGFVYKNITTGVSNNTGYFTGLTPATTYTFTAVDSAGCTSLLPQSVTTN